MRHGCSVAVVIPALNEEAGISGVLREIPTWTDEIVVVDNGCTDDTAAVAADAGARVVAEPQRGYGAACLAGIAALRDSDIIVFLDGDYSDLPGEMGRLVDPIALGAADLVIGSRTRGAHEPHSLTPQAIFGNRLACILMRVIWGAQFTDLGPFRAIGRGSLARCGMRDRGYGWTIEMQIRAVRNGVRVAEVPVSYRRRIGESKISGTVRGVLCAGAKILYTIVREALCNTSPRFSRGRVQRLQCGTDSR